MDLSKFLSEHEFLNLAQVIRSEIKEQMAAVQTAAVTAGKD